MAPALQKLPGLYADAFDSETIHGAASAELDPNKYQAGEVHALHAIEQTVGSDVQYENYRSDGTILMLADPDATKGGVDVLDAASASWRLRPAPRCSSRAASTKKKRPRAASGGLPGASSRYSLRWFAAQQLGDGRGLALVRRRLPAYLGGRHPRGGGTFGPRPQRPQRRQHQVQNHDEDQ